MIDKTNIIYDIAFYARYVFLMIFFLWAFYRAFVTEVFIRRMSFSLLTFTTVAVGLFIYERPVNLIGLGFYLSLAIMGLIDLTMETQKSRFYESFKRNTKKKLIHMTHSGNRNKVVAK